MLTGKLLAKVRQQQVMNALASEFFRLVGGDVWARAEEDETDRTGRDARAFEALSQAISRNPCRGRRRPCSSPRRGNDGLL